jgi:hypothetical protein
MVKKQHIEIFLNGSDIKMMQMRFIKLFVLIFFLLMMFSCQPEKEDTVSVYDVRNKILGYWKVNETSSEYGSSVYTVKIVEGNDSNEILIDNFYNIGNGKMVKCIVYENYLLDIKKQLVDDFIFTGNATVNTTSERIIFSYIVDDQGGIIDTVSSNYVK